MKRIALLLLFAAMACAPASSPRPAPDASAEIVSLLVTSTEGWNRGDLDAFLAPYADDATYVGSRGLLRGKQAIRAQYVVSYFGEGRVHGTLAFREIEVWMLGRSRALAVGRYFVTERAPGQADASGLFSLTLERRREGWRIIHDHSS